MSIPVRTFADALDIACLVGGVDPAADPNGFFSEGHYGHVSQVYAELLSVVAGKRIVFVDSITDLTRQAMAWARTRPESVSDKTGKPDLRGAYGVLAREVIGLLKHLQHAPGRTAVFVGILERVTDEFNREHWRPQMEGGKAARELPGIVDQVISMGLFLGRQAIGIAGAADQAADLREIAPATGRKTGLPLGCHRLPPAPGGENHAVTKT